ncbi:MAG TPA: NUDIX domain-containing protein, partial [Ignavibacteriaceae bacterium]
AKANINFQDENLTVKYNGRQAKVPISFISEDEYEKEEEENYNDEDEDEVEYSQQNEIPIYFTETSEEESDFHEGPKYVLNVIYNNKGIYLSRRNDPRKIMYNQWQSPGGKVEKGETSVEANLRETEEETGIKLKEENCIFIFNDPKYNCDVYVTKIEDNVYPQWTEPNKQGPWIHYTLNQYQDMARREETTSTHNYFHIQIVRNLDIEDKKEVEINTLKVSNPWNEEEETDEEKEFYNSPAIFLAEQEIVQEKKPKMQTGPMDDHQQKLFDKMVSEFTDIYSQGIHDIGRTNIIQHRVILKDENIPPLYQTPYSLKNPDKKKFVQKEIDDMEKNGFIRKSYSSWASPIVIVDKKDGSKRFCVD